MENRNPHTTNNPNTHIQNGHNLNTPVETVNPDSVSYEDGYVHGRATERSFEQQYQQDNAERTATRGLLLGFTLTALVGLVAGTLFYLNQRQESTTPVVVPVPNNTQQPNRETTIIERTTETTQESAPTRQEPAEAPRTNQPDIRIIVPNSGQQQPAASQNRTPQTAPTQPNSELAPNPPVVQPNTSTTEQSNTRNQASPTQPNTEIPTATTTESPDTTNPTSSESDQNQTQSDNSGTQSNQ
jgi:hypothetical protein